MSQPYYTQRTPAPLPPKLQEAREILQGWPASARTTHAFYRPSGAVDPLIALAISDEDREAYACNWPEIEGFWPPSENRARQIVRSRFGLCPRCVMRRTDLGSSWQMKGGWDHAGGWIVLSRNLPACAHEPEDCPLPKPESEKEKRRLYGLAA